MKILNAVIAILAGVGGMFVFYWIFNAVVERLSQRWERRIKPYVFVGPAVAIVALFLIYPVVQTVTYSFANRDSSAWVGFENYATIFQDDKFIEALFNNALWIIVVPTLRGGSGPSHRGHGRPSQADRREGREVSHLHADGDQLRGCQRDLEVRVQHRLPPRGTDRPALRDHHRNRVRAAELARSLDVQPQRPPADRHHDLAPGRFRDGAAVRGHQERPRGEPWRLPGSTVPARRPSSSASSFLRCGRP